MPYFSLTPADRKEMQHTIGIQSTDELFADIPASLREKAAAGFEGLGTHQSELGVLRTMKKLAAQNTGAEAAPCFLGAGIYDHFIPSLLPAMVQRGEFLTAYTPYQAESSQGTLQVIYEFQTLLCRLTGMEMANASLYDGATALAEAIILAMAATRKKRILLPASLSPAYRRVAKTYTQGLSLELEEIAIDEKTGTVDLGALQESLGRGGVAAVVLAQPNFFGQLEDAQAVSDLTHEGGALLISVFNPITLGALTPPGEYGADIAIGDGQSLGIPMSFGGPGLGVFCCREKYARLAPGRLVGLTADESGKRGFTLTLQTREQHIRREKATSNICSNQALCALMATIYMSALGASGIRQAATQSFHKAAYARDLLTQIAGVELVYEGAHFHEFALRLPVSVAALNEKLRAETIIGPYDLGRDYEGMENVALFCCTEKRTREEIEELADCVREIIAAPPSNGTLNGKAHLNGTH